MVLHPTIEFENDIPVFILNFNEICRILVYSILRKSNIGYCDFAFLPNK